LNANTVTSGNVLAYVAQGNCNLSVPIEVPDFSGVAISPANSIGSINYFLE
jgi:predicted Na+-dependent transporter